MVGKHALVRFALAAVNRLSAVVLVAAGTGWGQWSATEEAKLTASNAGFNDEFGYSVSISGDLAVIGAPWANLNTGGAYVFARNGSAWSEQQKLAPSDGVFGDYFGASVALEGDTIIVGAPDFECCTSTGNEGAAYVFERSGTTWIEQQKLVASASAPNEWDQFGFSVALSGSTMIVGAYRHGASDQGAAYVYVRSGSSWVEQKILSVTGETQFGYSVSASGARVLIGAASGRAYVFSFNGATWLREAEFENLGSGFGTAVALAEDTALVGAPYYDLPSASKAGAAFVFTVNGTTWSNQAMLFASDATNDDHFGDSVAIDGDIAVVGASLDDPSGLNAAGSAYVFARSGSTWTQQQKITASDGASGDQFGTSVAISGLTCLSGAFDDNTVWTGAGSAYAFALSPGTPSNYCTAGVSASGCQALLSSSGVASASASSGFDLLATGVEGAKDGLYFFGTNGQQANPWGNGTSYQCVVPPVKRAIVLAGTGTNGQCDGAFTEDLNALWCPSCAKPAKNPGAGALVQAQLWYRDPASTSNQTTSLSDAIEFGVGP